MWCRRGATYTNLEQNAHAPVRAASRSLQSTALKGTPTMRTRIGFAVATIAVALTMTLRAAPAAWMARTPWGEPDFRGEWTTEGEYGVPFERPAQYGSRAFLTDDEYKKRLDDVRVRNDKDLERVDVQSGRVDA